LIQTDLLDKPKGTAVISDCGRYRYQLTRKVRDDSSRIVNFIMLNPSTADANEDDPTIRRCIGYAKAWGCGKLIVTNLFAVRATDPEDMLATDDPVGEENDRYIKSSAEDAFNIYAKAFDEPNGLVVCAWGNHGAYMGQDLTTLGWIGHYNPMALRVSKTGQPAHPLYLPKNLQPAPYVGRVR
jgi:hypothetical protein